MRQKIFILSLALIVSAQILQGGSKLGKEEKTLKLVSASSDGVVLEYVPEIFQQKNEFVNGKPYLFIQSKQGGLTSEKGKPQLPELGTLVGIPPNVSIQVSVLESKYTTQVLSDEVLPAPNYTFDVNNEAVAHYDADRDFYERANSFYPEQIAEAAGISQLREQRVARIIVHPVQYNPTTKELKRLLHLKIKCTFVSNVTTSGINWATSSDNSQFDPVYKNLIINYSDAKQWRGKPLPATNSIAQDSTDWFVPGHPYFRIPVANDGMYRLTYFQLRDAGVDLRRVDINSLALYNKGISVPLSINSQSTNPKDWTIDFYAKRNYGVNSYFDLYSDTNHYWLSVDDANPLRFQEVPSLAGSPIAQPLYYTETIHFEQDLKYYFGYNSDEVSDPNDVPGEGWYWADFFPNNILLDTFIVDSVKRIPGGAVTMRARLHGMTKTTTPSQHLAEFRMNNIPVGNISWTDNTEALFTGTFPDSLLKSGSNYFRIRSAPTASPVNKIYVDWVELDYNRPLIAKNNLFEFTASAQPGSGPVQFSVSGFTTDSVEIYDLSGSRKILPLSSGGGTVVFQDSSASPKRYRIAPQNSQTIVTSLEPKLFKDFRRKTSGADYIVITHKNFINAANRLAQARATRGRLKSVVVDVQDIYDEFNYGLLKPDAIRDFLKYAYEHWPQPAPTYVVMFGDACWDFKGRMATTIKKNFVPAFGNPPSDNALVSFDPVQNYLPYMLIGRLPVENSLQADKLVTKILNYDDAPLDEWNKNSMFITGGQDSAEQAFFNTYSENLIEYDITPPPLEGHVDKIYKSSSVIVDGDAKAKMQGLVNKGLGYINFIGHSGGRLWNVDIGNPTELQNTSGKLPFVSSVSCNVGFFSAPNFNVLSEDFLLADNRGAIGVWSGSSIGYANVGWWLAHKFLSSAAVDYGRSLGQLTTVSRINFWAISYSTSPVVIQALQLHPLLGDPYTMLALPLQPDIDVTSSDIHFQTDQPTADSIIRLEVSYRNFGLVTGDSILVAVKDDYTTLQGKKEGESDVVQPFYVPIVGAQDSFRINWDVRGKAGSHLVKVVFDPSNIFSEVRKSNNTAEKTVYVYQNTLVSLKPVAFSVVHSGTQNLVVSLPSSLDTIPLQYFFEIDTTADFSSPAKIISAAIVPGPVSAQWQTPLLPDHQVYFWRARTSDGSKYGAWTFSSFTVNDAIAPADSILWSQSTAKQFQLNTSSNVVITDSGVSMNPSNNLSIFVRSVGSRAYPDSEFYSIIRIGEIKIIGYYFYGANSFIAARINPVNGAYQAKGYDLRNVGETDSLISFLQSTPVGYYVAIAGVSNARVNVTEALYLEIEALGSVNIRSVLSGESWCLLSRKGSSGPLMTPLESYSPSGIATVEFQLPNYYGAGAGSMTSPLIGPAAQWLSASWKNSNTSPATDITLTVYGIKEDSSADSLFSLSQNSLILDLSGVNPVLYPRIYMKANLNNIDGSVTPLLTTWETVYIPAPDAAIGAFKTSFSQNDDTLNIEATIFNTGYRKLEKGKVIVSDISTNTKVKEVPFENVSLNTSYTIQGMIISGTGSAEKILKAEVVLSKQYDAFAGNNVAYRTLKSNQHTGTIAQIYEALFDGKPIHNGDYVSPSSVVRIVAPVSKTSSLRILLDGKETAVLSPENRNSEIKSSQQQTVTLRPKFTDGMHTLIVSSMGEQSDSVKLSVQFNVISKIGILNFYNYPNPFQSSTQFAFILTGSVLPEELHVKIYTVAGRLIRQLNIPSANLQIGFNRVTWDGMDAEGDRIGNGYYFVKATVQTSAGMDEVIQKILKLE